MRRVVLGFCIALVVMTGCTASTWTTVTAPAGGTPGLAGSRWQLEALGAGDAPAPVIEGTRLTLEFQPDGKVSGDSGCNAYSGAFLIRDGKIDFGEMVSTLRACADERVNQQEQQYILALQSAGTIAQSGDRLTIRYENEQNALHFVRATTAAPPGAEDAADLENIEWQLESFGVSGSETPVAAGTRITLIASGGQLKGSAGCNVYQGPYQVIGNSLRVDALIVTERACLDLDAMDQEKKFLQALQSAQSFELQSGTFVITYDAGHSQLNFKSG